MTAGESFMVGLNNTEVRGNATTRTGKGRDQD